MIKTKAWDWQTKSWNYDYEGLTPSGSYIFRNSSSTMFGSASPYIIAADKSRCTVVESTGLIDKNGKDIFVGDVVKDETDGNAEWVVYKDEEALGYGSAKKYGTYHLCKSLEKSLEVVGNIFENTEWEGVEFQS